MPANGATRRRRRHDDDRDRPRQAHGQHADQQHGVQLRHEDLARLGLGRAAYVQARQQALELVLKQLKETQSNVEFLMKVSKSVPGQHDKD